MLYNINEILHKKDFFVIKILIFFNSLMFILEFLSIGLIPIFISVLISPDFLLDKLSVLNLENFFLNFSKNEIIIFVSFLLVFVFMLKSLFLIFITIFQNKFLQRIKVDVSSKIFSHYINMDYIEHLEKEPAELTRKISQDISMLGIYIQQFFTLYREIIALTVLFLLIVWSSPSVVLLIVSVLSFLVFFYLKKIKKILEEKSTVNKSLSKENIKSINEIFGSIKDLKILMKEQDMISYFKSNIEKIEKNLFFFQVVEKFPRIIIELIAVIILSIITVILILKFDNLNNFLPILALMVVAIFRFIPAFSSITSAKYMMQISKPFLKSLQDIFKEIRIKNNHKENLLNKNSNELNNLNNKVENKFISLKNVSFNYPGNKIIQLKNINFDIEKNTTVGITGQTGAGKSTLFYLMLGLIKPSKGSISHYGNDIYLSLHNWKKKIGIVSQNIFLLDNTIEKNIAFNLNREEVDKKKLYSAIKVAQLEKKIKELPLGVKTFVGNNGIKLSGGERQRLAISRLIYQDPEVIFLDESTSALDLKTEKLIFEAIKENFKDKTIVMIAHRESLIGYCDTVWKLENGELLNQKQ